MSGVTLGTGVLTWHSNERISDRYGTVWLMDPDADKAGFGEMTAVIDAALAETLVGKSGTLIAHVLETRPSHHVGDLFRGIYPETPEVGEMICLGLGAFFTAPDDDRIYVGLEPSDGRRNDWLDVKQLYRAHDQTVRLTFYPEAAQ